MIKKITEIGVGRMMLIASDQTKAEAATNAMSELLSTMVPLLAP